MAGLGIEIDDKLCKEFDDFVKKQGHKKYRAIEGALRAFMALPAATQLALMSNTVDAKELLIETFEKLSIDRNMAALSQEQKKIALAVIKAGAAKIAQRKKVR